MSDEDDRLGQQEMEGTHEGDYTEELRSVANTLEGMGNVPVHSDMELTDQTVGDTLGGMGRDINAALDERESS